jgi:hypothetical protein
LFQNYETRNGFNRWLINRMTREAIDIELHPNMNWSDGLLSTLAQTNETAAELQIS